MTRAIAAPGDNRALVALIAGGAAGIGHAIWSKLAEDGMSVLIADVNLPAARTADRRPTRSLSALGR